MAEAQIEVDTPVVIVAPDQTVRYGHAIWVTPAGYVLVKFYNGQIEWKAIADVQISNIQA